MNKIKRAAALLIAAATLISASACSLVTQGRYRILDTFQTLEYCIGFREGDNIRYYMEAAINTLAADGTLHAIALDWFGEDKTSFYADAEALERVGGIPERELIVGVDGNAFPMSYVDEEGENYSGFDVDCAIAVCERLGWKVKFQPMKAEDAYVELSSGNVDVAWGGLALDQTTKKFTVLSPYMEDDVVLVARVDSGIRSKLGMKGHTLAIDVDSKYMTLLDENKGLKRRLGEIKRVTGGAQACFELMQSAEAEGTITTRLAVTYYAK